jgi:hypothetical protein
MFSTQTDQQNFSSSTQQKAAIGGYATHFSMAERGLLAADEFT